MALHNPLPEGGRLCSSSGGHAGLSPVRPSWDKTRRRNAGVGSNGLLRTYLFGRDGGLTQLLILAQVDGAGAAQQRGKVPGLAMQFQNLGVKLGNESRRAHPLTRGDVVLGNGAHIRCMGKGRKERATPLRLAAFFFWGAALSPFLVYVDFASFIAEENL